MSDTSEKVIDKIIDNATSRLKIPIVSTYVAVLIFNSWDIIYYLLFQTGDATSKIKYIKVNHTDYWSIVTQSLLYAIIVIMLFTILDTGLSYGLRNVYKLKKKLTDDINDYKSIDQLKKINLELIDNNKKCISEIEKYKITDANLKNRTDSLVKELNNNSYNIKVGELFNTIFDYYSNLSTSVKLNLYLELIEFIHHEIIDKNKKNIFELEIFTSDLKSDIEKFGFVKHIFKYFVEKKYFDYDEENTRYIANINTKQLFEMFRRT